MSIFFSTLLPLHACCKADQFNEKFDKGTQPNTSPRDKLISFKATPLKSSKSNELGKKIHDDNDNNDNDDLNCDSIVDILVYSIKQRDSEVKNSVINNSNNNRSSNNINESTISAINTAATAKKMTTQQQSSPKKIDGIGPVTKEGMPLSLRSVNLHIHTILSLMYLQIMWEHIFMQCGDIRSDCLCLNKFEFVGIQP